MMHNFAKSCISLIALVGYSATAIAGTITSPAPGATVTAIGQLTEDLAGTFTTVCNVTLTGTVDADAKGITFTSMDGLAVGGPLDCNGATGHQTESLVMPLHIEATSSTSVTFRDMTYVSRIGDCGPQDSSAPWDNINSIAALSATLPGTTGAIRAIQQSCHISGNLTLSPSINIAD